MSGQILLTGLADARQMWRMILNSPVLQLRSLVLELLH